uniref:Integrator complex subunit 11 n=1 Tax=Macrostomum lignano TaxID=282301 RepID=A0A1I8JQA1_9PLAT
SPRDPHQKVPIYFSTGLAERANHYYKLFIAWTNEKIKQTFVDRNMFDYKHIRPLHDKSVIDNPGPMVVFATPGMLHAGQSLQIFKKWAPDERNMVVIPGYCVAGTVGYKIINGAKKIELGKQSLDVRMAVEYLSFSAHARRQGHHAAGPHVPARAVMLVHGESAKMDFLRQRIQQELQLPVLKPANGESVAIETEQVMVVEAPVGLLHRRDWSEPARLRAGLLLPPSESALPAKRPRLLARDAALKEAGLAEHSLRFTTSLSLWSPHSQLSDLVTKVHAVCARAVGDRLAQLQDGNTISVLDRVTVLVKPLPPVGRQQRDNFQLLVSYSFENEDLGSRLFSLLKQEAKIEQTYNVHQMALAFLATMSKKGLSFEEKRNRMLSFFHEKQDFFQLKEVERLCHKEKGITTMSAKEVLQSLVDDGLVDTDKIGTCVYFWAFPSKLGERLRRLRAAEGRPTREQRRRLEAELAEAKAAAAAADAAEGDNDGEAERTRLAAALAEAESANSAADERLKRLRDCDRPRWTACWTRRGPRTPAPTGGRTTRSPCPAGCAPNSRPRTAPRWPSSLASPRTWTTWPGPTWPPSTEAGEEGPRWFRLSEGSQLSYYLSKEEVSSGCRGSVNISVCDVLPSQHDPLRFDLSIPGEQLWHLRATTQADRQSWIVAIGSSKACVSNGSGRPDGAAPSAAAAAAAASVPSINARTMELMAQKKSELRLYHSLLRQQLHDLQSQLGEGECPIWPSSMTHWPAQRHR